MEPDFFVLGAQRAGTTSLYAMLSQHPSILPASRKELHFFEKHEYRGVRKYLYRAEYPLRRAGAITGEATPYYLFHPVAIKRVQAAFPQAKHIVVLRDPVQRAWSHYRLNVSRGMEARPFQVAIMEDIEVTPSLDIRLSSGVTGGSFSHQEGSYFSRGCYAGQIARLLENVAAARVLVLFFEALCSAPQDELQKVFSFLGLPYSLVPLERLNAAPSQLLEFSHQQELRRFYLPYNRALATVLHGLVPAERMPDWVRAAI